MPSCFLGILAGQVPEPLLHIIFAGLRLALKAASNAGHRDGGGGRGALKTTPTLKPETLSSPAPNVGGTEKGAMHHVVGQMET